MNNFAIGVSVALLVICMLGIPILLFMFLEKRYSKQEPCDHEKCIYSCSEEELQRRYVRIGEALRLYRIVCDGGASAAMADYNAKQVTQECSNCE